MISTSVLGALREYLDQTLHRLALPCAHLVRMDFVLRRDFLKRPLAAKRFQSHLRLQLPQNLPRLLLIRIPPSDGGIHRIDLRFSGTTSFDFFGGELQVSEGRIGDQFETWLAEVQRTGGSLAHRGRSCRQSGRPLALTISSANSSM